MGTCVRRGVVALSLFVSGCACHKGELTGAWVVAGSPGRAGVAERPRYAQPLALSGAGVCVPSQNFNDQFGTLCREHESEGPASTDPGGALPLGPHPTSNEVRWYCEGRSVVRLVLERCPASESYRITEVAVWMGGKH
jgi:hypothetical protein